MHNSRLVTLALLLGVASGARALPAPAEVSMTRAHGLIYVELDWATQPPLLALLDTGANASAIDPRVSAHLAAERRTEIVGTTGTLEAEVVALHGLRLGGLALPDLSATRRDLGGLLALDGRPVDLILGSDAFVDRALTIDFTAARLELATGVTPTAGSVPMGLDNGIPVLDANIDGVDTAVRIDTGASLFETADVYVNVPTRVWTELQERHPGVTPSTHFAGTGAGGETVQLPVVPVRNLRVGPLERESAFVIVQPEAGYFGSPAAMPFVSNNALEKLGRVTLDYAAGRFYAQLAAVAGAPADDRPAILTTMSEQAAAMAPLATSPLAREFLAAIPGLPAIGAPRVVLRNKAKGDALTEAQAASRTAEQLEGYERTELDDAFYYTTRYGTPVAFVRPLEILGQAGVQSADGQRLLDFGFGSIGQLRALASVGAQVTGVEVDPLLQALYSQPGDTGAIGRDGRLTLVFGRWPAEAAAVEQAGRGFDLFISKNTLKRGYIHPERPVDPRRLVQLGVDDETFVRAVFEALKPGGSFLIYNLCPAPAPEDKPYIPWADGRCPFARELCESAGFEVAAFDVDDTPAARAMGAALGWGADMDLEADLFGTYTLLRRPAAPR